MSDDRATGHAGADDGRASARRCARRPRPPRASALSAC